MGARVPFREAFLHDANENSSTFFFFFSGLPGWLSRLSLLLLISTGRDLTVSGWVRALSVALCWQGEPAWDSLSPSLPLTCFRAVSVSQK